MKKLLLVVVGMMLLIQLASATVVKIDSDKVLNIDGVRTFPVFASGLENNNWGTAVSGIQSSAGYITSNWITWRPNPWKIDSFSDINAMLPYFEATNPKVYTTASIMTCPSVDSMTCYVQTQPNMKNSPAFLGYVQIDEPDPNRSVYDSLSVLQNNYNVIHADDPNHPIFINFYATIFVGWPGIDYYYNTADVLGWDRYYITSGNNRADFQYSWEFGSVRPLSKRLIDYSKPFITWIQVNGAEGNDGARTFYVPTYQEIKLEAYGAIVFGVNGIALWTGHCCGAGAPDSGLLMNPSLFTSVKNLLTEIHSLNYVLIMPTVSNSVWKYYDDTTVSFSPNPTRVVDGGYGTMRAFSYILKKDPISGTLYLIVINKDASPQYGITMRINGLSGTTTATTLGMEISGSQRAGRVLNVNNGQFTDSFDGFAVHIYQIGGGNYVPPVPIPVPNPTYTPSQLPGFEGIVGICGLLMMFLIMRKR
jgi:hypothetical protein